MSCLLQIVVTVVSEALENNMDTGWIKRQKVEPKVVAIDSRNDGFAWRYEFVFECKDYVFKQFLGFLPHLTIEDYWNDEILAYTDGVYYFDNVKCAEEMMQNAKGNKYVSKSTVENIIYKLMIGDMKLICEEF